MAVVAGEAGGGYDVGGGFVGVVVIGLVVICAMKEEERVSVCNSKWIRGSKDIRDELPSA